MVLRTADHSLEIDPNGPARLLSTNDVILNSGTLDAAADEVTVSGGSVDVSSLSKMNLQAGSDFELKGAGGLVGRFTDPVDMVSGGLNFATLGNVSVVGDYTEVLAFGDMATKASGTAHVAT